MKRLRIAVSLGDPAGIGPEVTVRALDPATRPTGLAPLIVGDRRIVERALEITGVEAEVVPHDPGAPAPAGTLPVLERARLPGRIRAPGKPYADGARASVAWFDAALDAVLDGTADALVTAPVNKGDIVAAGIPFVGHTERLAERVGTRHPVMMLIVKRLRVALVTTHLPLAKVARHITRAAVERTLVTTAAELSERFGLERPRVALAALNPHAGDGGAIGREEREILAPAVASARARGLEVSGPYPSDTLFQRAVGGEFDAVVALYHDQGLIPIKLAGFGRGVNVTLGTPVVRTSPDHGTAYELAGSGRAEAESMRAAVRLAMQLARRRAKGAR